MNDLLLKSKNKAPVPDNESERLEALRSYNILDTDYEKGFDSIAKIAAVVCNAPVALVAFLDGHRNWFKAAVGVDIRESPRNISFCQHAILGDEVFEVPDAKSDDLFHESPLVQQNPGVRFYAGAPLVDDNGFRLGTVCVFDLRPRKLTEKQKDALKALAEEAMSRLHLRQLLEKEQQLGQLRSNFISMASHQLRTPLTVVQSNFDILLNLNRKEETIAPEKVERISTRINSEIERMVNLIDGVMDSVKSDSGISGNETQPIDLVEFAYKVKERIDQVQCDGRALKVDVQGVAVPCPAFEEKLEDILVNLVSNAFKYSKCTDSVPVLTIDFNCEGCIIIKVRDFGIGIPQEEIPFLFDPFYRASNTAKIQGTGLGLNIVKKHVEEHKGTISVVSKPGHTIFEVTLPRNTS